MKRTAPGCDDMGVVLNDALTYCHAYLSNYFILCKFKKMSLKVVGPIMFGGTPGIIAYFRRKGLSTTKVCGRYNIMQK